MAGLTRCLLRGPKVLPSKLASTTKAWPSETSVFTFAAMAQRPPDLHIFPEATAKRSSERGAVIEDCPTTCQATAVIKHCLERLSSKTAQLTAVIQDYLQRLPQLRLSSRTASLSAELKAVNKNFIQRVPSKTVIKDCLT